MGNGIRIGRILGVQISLHPSWFVIAVIVTYLMAAGQLPAAHPGWPEAVYWILGAIISLLFFASVLAHELSHARRRPSLRPEGAGHHPLHLRRGGQPRGGGTAAA